MNGKEAAQHRELIVKHHLTGEVICYRGDEVYSITPLGIVTALETIRTFYPWHRIEYFTYHNNDVAARRIIQGY